jgi:hypothetical protein
MEALAAMNALNVFISYQRGSSEFTDSLVEDIAAHNHNVWSDQQLPAGEEWWEQILRRIQVCDLFMFVVDSESIASRPCKLELGYAVSLDKHIMPVLYTDSVPPEKLPPELARRNILDLRGNDRSAYRELTKALGTTDKAGPLPNPLPKPPDIPIPPIGIIANRLNDPAQMQEREQVWFFHQLKKTVCEFPVDSKQLLQELRDRDDTVQSIRTDIDAYLLEAAARVAEPIPPEKPESPQGALARIGRVFTGIAKIIPFALFGGFFVYLVVDDSRSFSYKFERDTAVIRNMVEQLDDPGFPDRALLAAHEELEAAREKILREHRLDDVFKRPVDEDFAGWHIAVAEAGRHRGMRTVVEVNVELAEKLDTGHTSIPSLKQWLLDPTPTSAGRGPEPAVAVPTPYSFRVVDISVTENGDSWIFGKTDAYLTLSTGSQALSPASFPTVENASQLRLGDKASVTVDYPFTLDLSTTVMTDLVQLKLYDYDDKNAEAPYRNELLGHFSVNVSVLTALAVEEKMQLVSKDLAIGAANATLTLVRSE